MSKNIELDGAHIALLLNKQSNCQYMNEINSFELNEIKKEEECDVTAETIKFEGPSGSGNVNTESNDDLPIIPNGGWGGVVVLSALIISACVDGLEYSCGLVLEKILIDFRSSIPNISVIGNLFILTSFISGPIVSVLVDKYGCRLTTIAAGLVSTIGFLLAAVSNSMEMLCLTFGFISGLAKGVFYVTAVVPIVYWFDKNRNFAVSLASGGLGFETFLYSSMTHYLLRVWNWRNTVVLLAGTLLNMCVCGAVMRDPDWLIIKQNRKRKMAKSIKTSRTIGGMSSFLTQNEFKKLIQSGKSPDYILHTLATTISESEKLKAITRTNAEHIVFKRVHSNVNLPTFIQRNEKVPVEVIQKLLNNKRLDDMIIRNHHDLMRRKSLEDNFIIQNKIAASKFKSEDSHNITVKVKKYSMNNTKQNKKETISLIQFPGNNDSMDNIDIDSTIETVNINVNSANIPRKSNRDTTNAVFTYNKTCKTNQLVPKKAEQDLNCIVQTFLHESDLSDEPFNLMDRDTVARLQNYKLHAVSSPNIYQNSTWTLESKSDDELKWYKRFWHTILNTLKVKMFNELHFVIFIISSIILSTWKYVPFLFLQNYMYSLNLKYGKVIINIIDVAKTIGVLSLGLAGDQSWIHIPKVYSYCIIICGISVACYPLCITKIWALAIISWIFGFTFGSTYSYTPAMLLELMPIDHFTIAYGFILFTQGVGLLIGPPLAELLFVKSGKIELTFYISGTWIVVSGLCLGVIAYTKNIKIFGSGPLLKALKNKRNATEVPSPA